VVSVLQAYLDSGILKVAERKLELALSLSAYEKFYALVSYVVWGRMCSTLRGGSSVQTFVLVYFNRSCHSPAE